MNQNLINSWSKPYSSNNIIDHPIQKESREGTLPNNTNTIYQELSSNAILYKQEELRQNNILN